MVMVDVWREVNGFTFVSFICNQIDDDFSKGQPILNYYYFFPEKNEYFSKMYAT